MRPPSSPPRLLAASLVVLLWGCSGPRTGEPSALDREARLAAGVSPERAASRVRALCALGPRMGGTPSGARAAEFARLAFSDLGLDARLERDPPRRAHSESSWRVTARSTDGEERDLASAWPYGFSPSARGSAALSLEDEDDGVLLCARAPRSLPADGPALVLVDGATTLDGSYPVVQHLRAGRGAGVPHFGLSRPDGAWLRERLAAGQGVRVEFELTAEIDEGEVLTAVARLPARQPQGPAWTEDHFLFCAHGDSDAGGPGADDNASGIATLLEIASAWSEAIAAGLVEAPEREVRFAVWGSEIHSSRAYLSRRGPTTGRVLGVINFDQTGFGSGAERLFVEPDDLPANRLLTRTLLQVLRDHAPHAVDGGTPGSFPREWATVPSLGGTDSYVFSEAPEFESNELPSMTVYSSAWGRPQEHARTPDMPGESWSERDLVEVDFDNYYHSAGDTPANTTDREAWNMAWCARVAMLAARRFLAGGPEAP